MSPRRIVEVACECRYAECDQHYSSSRGLLRRTIICRHPDNAGCLCVLQEAREAECELCQSEEGQKPETVHIEVKAE